MEKYEEIQRLKKNLIFDNITDGGEFTNKILNYTIDRHNNNNYKDKQDNKMDIILLLIKKIHNFSFFPADIDKELQIWKELNKDDNFNRKTSNEMFEENKLMLFNYLTGQIKFYFLEKSKDTHRRTAMIETISRPKGGKVQNLYSDFLREELKVELTKKQAAMLEQIIYGEKISGSSKNINIRQKIVMKAKQIFNSIMDKTRKEIMDERERTMIKQYLDRVNELLDEDEIYLAVALTANFIENNINKSIALQDIYEGGGLPKEYRVYFNKNFIQNWNTDALDYNETYKVLHKIIELLATAYKQK